MELTRFALLLCLAALSSGQEGPGDTPPAGTSPARPGPPGTKYVCRQIQGCDADIAMLVDKSGSITAPEDGGARGNWRILKDFIYAVMSQTQFGEAGSGSQFSVLFFANNANLKVKFNECKDIQCAKDIIEKLIGPGGKTNTDAALQTALTDIYTVANGDRSDKPDIILLITDGKPNPYNPGALAATIAQIRARGIRVIGVGIGNGVDDDIMRSLVAAPASENYFQIKDFTSIDAELEEILERACTVCEYVPCITDWSKWSACSVTCEEGTMTRTRVPRDAGDICEGSTTDTTPCIGPRCECFGPWGEWSACGGGMETRNRDKLVERRCEGSTSQSRACAPEKGGCDPETIDFYTAALKVEPYEKFNHEWLTGWWYASRWYLPQKKNVSDEPYDKVKFGYKKPGNPDVISYENFSRVKTSKCCSPMQVTEFQKESAGVYDMMMDGKNANHVIYPDASDVFLIEVYCMAPNEAKDRCDDYGLMMWSRCPEPRAQDIARALTILKKICYPHMNRFLCMKHEKDCTKMNYHDDDMMHKDCGCDRKTKCLYHEDDKDHMDDHDD